MFYLWIIFALFLLLLSWSFLRKDTYAVFSEPVDPNEVSLSFSPWTPSREEVLVYWNLKNGFIHLQLPDYHDVIKHPMDFGTVRKRLSSGYYSNLEMFEVCTLYILSTTFCLPVIPSSSLTGCPFFYSLDRRSPGIMSVNCILLTFH